MSKTVASPDVASISPRRILRSVLLPAPFDPTSPTMPRSMSTVRPSSAVTPPGYCFVSDRREMRATPEGYPSGTSARLEAAVGRLSASLAPAFCQMHAE
jgi:hypothetical protein